MPDRLPPNANPYASPETADTPAAERERLPLGRVLVGLLFIPLVAALVLVINMRLLTEIGRQMPALSFPTSLSWREAWEGFYMGGLMAAGVTVVLVAPVVLLLRRNQGLTSTSIGMLGLALFMMAIAVPTGISWYFDELQTSDWEVFLVGLPMLFGAPLLVGCLAYAAWVRRLGSSHERA